MGLANVQSPGKGKAEPPGALELKGFEAILINLQRSDLRFQSRGRHAELRGRTRRTRLDPTRPITTLKTAWANVRERSGVNGRLHDTRHTLITELAESGAGDETIIDIAGHVSRQMLRHYSHIRMQAKREALEAV